jgi:hypothetical protein
MHHWLVLAASLLIALPAVAADLPVRPDPTLTPGAILTTDAVTVCQPGYSKSVRHTSGKLKAHIYLEYGVDRTASHFEVDHLISLELGGADVAANLWPQSYDTLPWNAHVLQRLVYQLLFSLGSTTGAAQVLQQPDS